MVCIGKEITEELECESTKFYIKDYIRYKYAAKNGDGVSIAELPERVIDKGIAEPSSLAMILVGNIWATCCCTDRNRSPQGKIYRSHHQPVIKVLDSDKKGATHQGHFRVHHSSLDKTVLFDYNSSLADHVPKSMLDNFKGYLQTDGYTAYEKFGKKKGITHLTC